MDELDRFSTLSRKLFETVPSWPIPAHASAKSKELLQQLQETQKRLLEVAESYDYRIDLQRQIKTLKDKQQQRQDDVRQVLSRIRSVEASLEEVVHLSKKKLAHVERAEKTNLDLDVLLRYAHMISTAYSTSAPKRWNADDPRRPYPQEMELNSGILPSVAAEVRIRRGVRAQDGTGETQAREEAEHTTTFFQQHHEEPTHPPAIGAQGGAKRSPPASSQALEKEGAKRAKEERTSPTPSKSAAAGKDQEFYVPDEYLESDEDSGSEF